MKFTAPFGHPARGSPLQHTRQRKSGENGWGGVAWFAWFVIEDKLGPPEKALDSLNFLGSLNLGHSQKAIYIYRCGAHALLKGMQS